MKKGALKLIVAITTISATATSCSDDGYSVNNFAVSWGTAKAANVITRDDGATLNIVSTLYPYVDFTSGERLIVDYTTLGEGKTPKSYNVRLNGFSKILTKAPITESFINQDYDKRNDSIGNSPIEVNKAWFSAGKYLNVDFSIGVDNSAIRHFINLEQDNVTDSSLRSDSVYLTLRHNAYNDIPRYRAFGYVSFDIVSIIRQGKDSAPVKLIWTGYDGKTHFDTGTFTKRGETTNFILNKSETNRDKSATPITIQ